MNRLTPPPLRLPYCKTWGNILDYKVETPFNFMLAQYIKVDGKQLAYIEADKITAHKHNPLTKNEEGFFVTAGSIYFTQTDKSYELKYVDVKTFSGFA